MNDKINILCATDNNYVPYCGIMLTSVFENNKDVAVNAFVLIDKPLNKKNQHKMEQLAKQYGQFIKFVLVDNTILQKFPTKTMSYWSIATYYRMFAEELLPTDVDKILYLDCDIIVDAPIKDLFDKDMSNIAVAASDDIYIYSDERQKLLEYPPQAGYFNAGVLLINLAYWRKHQIGKQCIEYLSNNYDKIVANDQDVLNAVLWDKKIHLPLKYNYQLQFLSKHFFNLQTDEIKDEILTTFNNPAIIHYAYSIKPWSMMYYKLPLANRWEHYKRMSPWSHIGKTLPTHKPLNNILKRYIFWPLGLMKYKSGFIK